MKEIKYKRIVLMISGVVLLLVLIMTGIYIDAKNKFSDVSIQYQGIEGQSFSYQLNDAGLNCNVLKAESLANGDELVINCKDNVIGAFTNEKKIEVSGLWNTNIESGKFRTAISPYVFESHSCYVMQKPDGLAFFIIYPNENSEGYYNAYFYDEVFLENDHFVKNIENSDGVEEATTNFPTSIKVTDIQEEYLAEYIQLYTEQGYEKYSY